MTKTVKRFFVGYYTVNKSYIFTSGDNFRGKVTLELAKRCTIDSLCVKLKGKAEVFKNIDGFEKVKIFSIKQFLILEGRGNNIVDKGCHVYPFTFQIPAQDLPSSFEGSWGKIVYSLEANLSRSLRVDSKSKMEFTVIQRNLHRDPALMYPQQKTTEKEAGLFTSGKVGMNVKIQRSGFHRGEGIQVVASIQNTSSCDIKPKYCLYCKESYFGKRFHKVNTKDILKEVGGAIPPSAAKTVTRIITIPPTTCVSILNCDIIKVEYWLKVYLDVKYASDPKVKFPIVILPALQELVRKPPAYPTSEAFAGSNMLRGTGFPPNPTASGPSAPPPPYGTYEMYPPLTDFNGKS